MPTKMVSIVECEIANRAAEAVGLFISDTIACLDRTG
jgi:hypothetical protein